MKIITGKKGLKAPSVYWTLSLRQKADICNGCGPKGWGWVVPDRFRFIGVDFTEPCNIHDTCYAIQMPKKEADNLFLENMLTASQSAYFGCKTIACHFAYTYFLFVKNGGAGSYNRNKKGKP